MLLPQVPFFFKHAVDALSIDPTGQTTAAYFGMFHLAPVALLLGYGISRWVLLVVAAAVARHLRFSDVMALLAAVSLLPSCSLLVLHGRSTTGLVLHCWHQVRVRNCAGCFVLLLLLLLQGWCCFLW